MSRTADHEQRRRQVVDAVRAVALSRGLGGVTVANTATAAGVSVGLVQHYYGSKEDLLVDTFSSVRADIVRRVETATARAERRHARIEQMMLAGLLQLLPLDERRRREVYLTRAFAGLALENPRLRAHLERSDDELVQRVATAVGNGKTCGEVPSDTDADVHAWALLSLAEGLAARLLVHTTRRHRAHARLALTHQVAATFPGPCARERAPR